MSISDFAKQPDPEPTEWKADGPTETPAAPTEPVESSDGKPNPESAESSPEPSSPEPQPVPSTNTIVDGILGKIKDIGTGKVPLKLMVIGPPGSTKSSFTATAENNLIVDFEDGLISAKASPNGIGAGTQMLPYENFEEFVQTIRMVKEHHPALEKFETFSIDTFSDLHKRGLAEITTREFRKKPSLNQYVPEVEHHTENNEKLLRIIRILRDLDRNIIITAHSKTVEPKNKPAKTYADFSESLSNKIMAQMDIVGYMEMRKIEGVMTPVMRVITDGTVQVKSRIALPEEIANPTFPQILKVWEESKK